MADSNFERIEQGLEALKQGLSPYLTRQLKAHYNGNVNVVLCRS